MTLPKFIFYRDILILNKADSIKNIEDMSLHDWFYYGSIWKAYNKHVAKLNKG